MTTVTSKQTGSIYNVLVEVKDALVAYRPLLGEDYRLRIQSDDEYLLEELSNLPGYSDIKGDHVSKVVSLANLPYAVADAVAGVVLAQVAQSDDSTLVSAQTGSVYTVFNRGDDPVIAYRELGTGYYRVRIQSDDSETLDAILIQLPETWGDPKGDHVSITVARDVLPYAVADAARAIIAAR